MREEFREARGIYGFRISKEIRDQLPPKCRKCPVIRFLDAYSIEAQRYRRRLESKAFKALDSAKKAPERAVGAIAIRQAEASRLTEEANRAANDEEASRSALERVLSLTDETCPGTALGDLTETSSFYRAFGKLQVIGFLPPERSCLNPAFDAVKEEPTISSALVVGNWVGGMPKEL